MNNESKPLWDTCPYRASKRDGKEVGDYPIINIRSWQTHPPAPVQISVSVPAVEKSDKGYNKLDSQPGFDLSRTGDGKTAFLSAPFSQMEAMARAVLDFCEQQRAEWQEQYGDRIPTTTEVNMREPRDKGPFYSEIFYREDVWPRIK